MLAEATQIRQTQGQIVSLAQRDLTDIFRLAEGLPPEAARNLVVDTLPGVAQTYGDLSASASAEWFEQLRTNAVGSTRRAVLAESVRPVVVEQSTRFAAQHLFTEQPQIMKAYLAGALAKWVSQPGRGTLIDSIDADPIGVGWQRVVRPDGCDFCKMLADRGGVYMRKSVWFAAHNNCNCAVVPSWDPTLPEVNVKAYEASKRMESIRRRAEGRPVEGDIPKRRQRGQNRHKSDQEIAQAILDDHRANIRDWTKDF